ncbi:MAG: hypothetical protein ACREAM_25415 [Blastocatellia bacterium]
MFCRDFENIAGDLSSERLAERLAEPLMGAGTRERALRHAAECAACAARLNAERALDAGLRMLAESDEDGKAPAHLKPALRAAFDQQAKMSVPSVLTFPPARARNWARWSLAAAALILFAIAIALLSRNVEPDSNNPSGKRDPAPAPAPASREQSPQHVIAPGNLEPKVEKHVAGTSRSSIKRRAPRRPAALDEVADDNETVTDYIPLTADATAVESGIVIRVEMSRSALIAMGLPVNAEGTDSRVKADVVVGDDGVARAVRFVR